jgi:hypothetical protein
MGAGKNQRVDWSAPTAALKNAAGLALLHRMVISSASCPIFYLTTIHALPT